MYEDRTTADSRLASKTDSEMVDVSGAVATTDTLPPVFVIRPRPGWRSIDLNELWQYRELLYFLTWRDIKVRYKQSVLGAAWAVIQPVMTMVVFTIFFGKFGGMASQAAEIGVSYQILVYSALLPWQFFASSVTQGGQSLVSSANLISKVYFPRLLIPIGCTGAGLVDFGISFGVMMCLMAYYKVALTVHLLALPICFFGTLLAALGVGMILSGLTVAYRDFRYVVGFLVQIWMLASPVAYRLEKIPEQWRLLYALNPMAGIISGYRSALLGIPFYWGPLTVSLAVSAALFIGGAFYFRRIERRFADIV